MANFQGAKEFVLNKLENEIPDHITYHTIEHTRNVLQACEILAKKEHISGVDLELLKIAALFHDIGFIKSHIEHERVSCDIARIELPQFEYTPLQIEMICKMIMATKLPQKPKDHLSKILCDGDLYYLGGTEYEYYADKLFKEFKSLGRVSNKLEWLLLQKDFLSSHSFFTHTARKEKTSERKERLKEVKAKIYKMGGKRKVSFLSILWDSILLIAAVVISGFALKGFLVPNHFFDGGISGIALLVSDIFNMNLSLAILVLNIPLIIISYFSVGKRFAFRTLIGIILLSVTLLILPDVVFTSDKLLIAVFGGFFLGVGVGLGIRAGAALDGIDVLAVYTFKKTSFSMTEIVMAINVLIFSVAAIMFDIETAMYSILTYFAATLSADYVVEGLQAHIGVTIISAKSDTIKSRLVNHLGRAITVYKGERGFLPGQYDVSSECDIIFTVISRLEMRKLKNLVYDIDDKAFVIANSIKEATGGLLSRRGGY
jgi:uncharacterized membrane-anchored protein YitT (DUF2179 family)/predicted metal-dependent HD superfamily phosphohydrolase